MEKTLKPWGSGLGIYFNSNEIEKLEMKEGDKIDLSDMFLINVQSLKQKGIYKKIKNKVKNGKGSDLKRSH